MVAPIDPSQSSQSPESSSDSPRPAISARKRRANRRNAQQSTGPRTAEGKAKSCRNATTHGIFCQHMLLPGEDPAHFHLIRDGFIDALRPQDALQLALVDTMVTARWRMNRCQFAEAVIIEDRIKAASAKVKDRFESLQRSMCFEDFSPAALHAQCERSELFRSHFEKFKRLRAQQDASLQPGHAIAGLMYDAARGGGGGGGDAGLERLGRYEHRFEQSFHRCLRDLHVLKQRAREYADEPPSPFRSQWVVADADADDADGNAAHGGDRAGSTSDGGVGVPAEHPSGATKASAPETALGRDAQAAQEPAPDAAEDASVQNEPTAHGSAASPLVAEISGASSATAPDPEEMARLAKFTDHLSRRRRSDDEVDDDDGYAT